MATLAFSQLCKTVLLWNTHAGKNTKFQLKTMGVIEHLHSNKPLSSHMESQLQFQPYLNQQMVQIQVQSSNTTEKLILELIGTVEYSRYTKYS